MNMVQTSTSVLPFLGPDVATTDAAQVVILPIPYEATTTYRRGCENGTDSILEASQQVEYYNEELDAETCRDIGIYTYESIAYTRNGSSVSSEAMLKGTRDTVSKLIADDKFVIGLGGERSITTGIVEAFCSIPIYGSQIGL
ncbi:arginase family protein [Cyanobacteria bacterium FACHB-472]|nr:arginase family protein [Cyanobacteria bacterium FACHB-472]